MLELFAVLARYRFGIVCVSTHTLNLQEHFKKMKKTNTNEDFYTLRV